ncbi:MAG: hypothetical protein JWN40_3168 [Phycisphaerales bacterium]|nr:hypothetical protein [Phycisphaerales bacterium]
MGQSNCAPGVAPRGVALHTFLDAETRAMLYAQGGQVAAMIDPPEHVVPVPLPFRGAGCRATAFRLMDLLCG